MYLCIWIMLLYWVSISCLGCKIKSLRAKTNTYIKTPVRGEEPVFVVTGRKEDVSRAKHEILSAAEHFSQIRASLRTAASATSQTNSSGNCSPISVPGHVTIQVRVPYKVVGLVVGPKGATIKRIQQATSTYIVTPGRDKEPVFEVTGLPDSVEKAREEIEKHIASRTGTDNNSDLQIDDFNINGIDSGYDQHSSDSSNTPNNEGFGTFGAKNEDTISVMTSNPSTISSYHQHHMMPSAMVKNCNSCSTGGGNVIKAHNTHRHVTEDVHSPFTVADYMKPYNNSSFNTFNHMMMNGGGSDHFDVDEGIGTSGGSIFDPSAAAIWASDVASSFAIQRSNSIGVSSARILPPGEDSPHPRTRRTNSDPLAAAFQAAFTSSSRSSSQASTSPVTGRRNNECHQSSGPNSNLPTAAPSSAQHNVVPGGVARCIVCGYSDLPVSAAATLIPCGHSSFCIKCAGDICQRAANGSNGGVCPICQEIPRQIRLH